MPGQDLVAAFMGDHRYEGEILWVGIALKSLRIDAQEITFRRATAAVLGAARLAVNVSVLDAADKAELPVDARRSLAAGALFARSQRSRLGGRHQGIIGIPGTDILDGAQSPPGLDAIRLPIPWLLQDAQPTAKPV
jgi:hypothetical protein